MGEKLICSGRYPEGCSRQYYENRIAKLEQKLKAEPTDEQEALRTLAAKVGCLIAHGMDDDKPTRKNQRQRFDDMEKAYRDYTLVQARALRGNDDG